MADEPRYADEIRIPISMTLPWSGKLTREGKPWPRDARGRDWPSHRGRPVFPINQLPIGFAPGTNEIYRKIAERERDEVAAALAGSVAVAAEAPLTPSTLVQVAAAGRAWLVPLAELAGSLGALEIGLPVALVIGSAYYSFHNSPVAQRWARQLLGLPPDVETLPAAKPIPPQPPTAEGPKLPPHNGDSEVTVRLPPLTPGSTAPSLPSVMPGAEIAQEGPLILETRRNQGLEGDERTNTDRARKAARRVDPEVTKVLKENEWRAHHLISMEAVRSRNAVLAAAGRAGWKTDEDANIAALPTTEAAQQKLREAGIERPLDNSGHPRWNDRIRDKLGDIRRSLDRDFGVEDSSEKDQAAKTAVRQLLRELRQELSHLRRISANDGNSGSTSV